MYPEVRALGQLERDRRRPGQVGERGKGEEGRPDAWPDVKGVWTRATGWHSNIYRGVQTAPVLFHARRYYV